MQGEGISSRYHPDSAWLQHKSNHALILGTCSYQTVTWLASIPTYISGLKLRDELYMYSNVSVLTNPTLCDNQVHFFPSSSLSLLFFTSTNRKINFSSGTVSFVYQKTLHSCKHTQGRRVSLRVPPDSAWLQYKSNHTLILGTCSYQTVTWLASIPTYVSGLKLRDELYMYSNVSVLTNPTLCDNQVHFFPFIVFIIFWYTYLKS